MPIISSCVMLDCTLGANKCVRFGQVVIGSEERSTSYAVFILIDVRLGHIITIAARDRSGPSSRKRLSSVNVLLMYFKDETKWSLWSLQKSSDIVNGK